LIGLSVKRGEEGRISLDLDQRTTTRRKGKKRKERADSPSTIKTLIGGTIIPSSLTFFFSLSLPDFFVDFFVAGGGTGTTASSPRIGSSGFESGLGGDMRGGGDLTEDDDASLGE